MTYECYFDAYDGLAGADPTIYVPINIMFDGENMRTMLFTMCFLLSGAAVQAADPIRATLEPSTNQAGWFVMHITNVSTNTIRFMDVGEGTHACGDVYEILVEKDGKTYKSELCLYSPFGTPEVVELAPGRTYDRGIQPGAYYLGGLSRLASPYTISVKYRITDKMKNVWGNMTMNVDSTLLLRTGRKSDGIRPSPMADVDVNLVFRTGKLEIGASHQVPEDTARKLADPQH
jgi:hypothetical protein